MWYYHDVSDPDLRTLSIMTLIGITMACSLNMYM
jgi:hypothetical protein